MPFQCRVDFGISFNSKQVKTRINSKHFPQEQIHATLCAIICQVFPLADLDLLEPFAKEERNKFEVSVSCRFQD